MARPEIPLPDEFTSLGEDDPCTGFTRAAVNLWVVHDVTSWSAWSKWASCFLPGLWMNRDDGCTWANGSRRMWFTAAAAVPAVLEAMGCVMSLGLDAAPGWGSMGGTLCRYLDAPVPVLRSATRLVREWPVPALHAIPGQYQGYHLADVQACYWSLWCRLPSLRVFLAGGPRLIFGRESDEVSERRVRVAAAVGGNKRLRNCVISAAHGSFTPRVAWHRGQKITIRPRPGPFQGAGLLVVRTAAELCHYAAVQTDAVISNTDCVVCPRDRWPAIWADHGLTVRLQAEGDCEVYNVGSYRVGGHATGWYQRGSRLAVPDLLPARPEREYFREWLVAA